MGRTQAICLLFHCFDEFVSCRSRDGVLVKELGRNIKHRRPTHIFTHWLIVVLVFTLVWDYQGIGMAFVWGGVSHILTDAMTVSGCLFPI
ncbi:metal-dependent hydrolase [Vibrio sp. MMG022]|uniref:metal-dependent hydrolase n=1 Tax=Vibrio sp. MMG023 TaxID=2909979 RepID=UPI001F3CDEB6|nr:metal-dependent hydrolase [Vibrio sp. MMG023]MCF6454573.1 metal-dependent hydrolase [Vibrio sp. MMG023]